MGREKTEFASRWLNGGIGAIGPNFSGGDVFFVDSGATLAGVTASHGKSPDTPFSTLDAAIARCTANSGDIIFIMPGHAENLALDSTVDIDVEGITVIGLGFGAAKPTFTCTVNVGDFKLAAAGTVVRNLRFVNNVATSTGMVEVSAAYCKILDCEFIENDVALFANMFILTTTLANDLEIAGCKIYGNAGDGSVSGISLVGADRVHIHDCYIYGDYTAGCIDCAGEACLRLRIHDCVLHNEDDTVGSDLVHCVEGTIAGNTGEVGPNVYCVLGVNDDNITLAVDANFTILHPVHVVNLAGEAGMAINTVLTTDA